MIQTRIGVFETNSSSSHSFILCSDEEYKKLNSEELYIWEGEDLVTFEEAKALYREQSWVNKDELPPDDDQEAWKFLLFEDGLDSFESWSQNDDVWNFFHEKYQTAHGDVVHMVGKHYGC